MLPAALRCVLAASLISTLPIAAHGSGKARVRGAASVNVRAAPSTESEAILWLPEGREVTVEKVVGDWALITLEKGRRGYVKAVFLALPAGLEVVAGPPATPALSPQAHSTPLETSSLSTPVATGVAMPTHTPAAAGTPFAPGEEQAGGGLQREIAEMRQRLAMLESAVAGTPTGPAGVREDPGGTPVAAREHDEPTRAAVFVPTVAQPSDSQEFGPSLALAGVGLVIGFLLGAAYGQRQERNRRTRVRF